MENENRFEVEFIYRDLSDQRACSIKQNIEFFPAAGGSELSALFEAFRIFLIEIGYPAYEGKMLFEKPIKNQYTYDLLERVLTKEEESQ